MIDVELTSESAQHTTLLFAGPSLVIEDRNVLDDASIPESKKCHELEVKCIPFGDARGLESDGRLVAFDDHRNDVIADSRERTKESLIRTGHVGAGARMAEIRRHDPRIRGVQRLQGDDIVPVERPKELVDDGPRVAGHRQRGGNQERGDVHGEGRPCGARSRRISVANSSTGVWSGSLTK